MTEKVEWLDKELAVIEKRIKAAVSRGDKNALLNLEKRQRIVMSIRKDYDDEGNFTGRTN